MGNYIGAAIFCEKVLKLLQSKPDPDLEQSVRVRMGKSYMLAKRPAQAAKAIGALPEASEDKRQIEQSIQTAEATEKLFPDTAKLRGEIRDRISRFKFSL